MGNPATRQTCSRCGLLLRCGVDPINCPSCAEGPPHKRLAGALVFALPDPRDPTRTLWCPPCVISVGCPQCRSPVGTPCLGTTRYIQDTHFMRRDLYRVAKRFDFKIPREEFELLEERWAGRKVPRKVVRPPEIVNRRVEVKR